MHKDTINPDDISRGEIPKLSLAIVTKAAEEHKANPMTVGITKCCALDKAILVSICKHGRAVSEGPMTVMDIWKRLEDTLSAADKLPDDCRVSVPPYYMFRQSLDRLVRQRLLHWTHRSSYSIDEDLVAMNLSHSDVLAALRGHPFLQFA